MTNIAIAEGLWFKLPRKNQRTRHQGMMSDHSNVPTNQAQIDSRANLFYLLQTLAGEMRAAEQKVLLDSSVTNHHIEAYVSRNGILS